MAIPAGFFLYKFLKTLPYPNYPLAHHLSGNVGGNPFLREPAIVLDFFVLTNTANALLAKTLMKISFGKIISSMKTFKLTYITLLAATLLLSCKKEDDTKDDTGNSGCAGSVSFCMEYGNSAKSGNATLSEPPGGRYRIYWENTSGASFEQVELDIYGSSPGTYVVDTSESSGSAFFQYYSNATGSNNGLSGSLNLTQFDPDGAGLSGSFEVITEDGTKVTKGNFINVKK